MESNEYVSQLQKELQEKQSYIELLEAAIDLSIIGYLICDSKGYVLKVNTAHSNISGWDPVDMIGKHMSDIGKVDNHTTAIMEIVKSHKPIKLERHLKNGKSFLVYGNPYFDSNNQLKYVICNLVDTTEINSTKKELEKTKSYNSRLFLKIRELENKAGLENGLVYHSEKMNAVIDLCCKIAQFDSTVLITGESGVGKELIADIIFKKSARKDKVFMKLNCASIPENLLESELFGYEQGSFTGASQKGKKGILEHSDKGTLLLDEIGEMSVTLQAKLLRFLQQGEFYRVGGHTLIKTDVRILASTNRDLDLMVRHGSFREDLFYRLNVIPIKVPSLSERKEDIPLLIKYFMNQFNNRYGLNKEISLEVIQYLTNQPLRGNIRELQNIVERLILLSEDNVIEMSEVSRIFKINDEKKLINICTKDSLKKVLEAFEKDLLEQYVKEYKSAQKISEILQISQPTMSRKLSKYGIKIRNIQK